MLPEPVWQVARNEKHIVYLVITYMVTDQCRTMPLQDRDQFILRVLMPVRLKMGRLIHPARKALVHIRLYFLNKRLHN